LFRMLPEFDPKKEKYRLFKHEWELIQTGIIGFMAYMQLITYYVSLNKSVSIIPLMFAGLGLLFIILGNFLSKIRQNYFIGIKVPWTLSDEDNWNKTHRFASWCFVGAGLLTLTGAIANRFPPMILFGSLILAGILPVLYSYLLYKKALSLMKYVYTIMIVTLILLFMVLL
jgi:uncharacterized membrane protein